MSAATFTIDNQELVFQFYGTESVLSMQMDEGVILHAPITGEMRPKDASGKPLVTDGVVLVGASGELISNDNLKFDGSKLIYGGKVGGSIVPQFEVNAETGAVTAGSITLAGNIVLGDDTISQDASTGLIATIGNVRCQNVEVTSDARLKTYAYFSGPTGIAEIQALRPVEYAWRDDVTNRMHRGFLAQDVEKVIPNAVSQNRTTMYDDQRSVDIVAIVASLVCAVQELSAKKPVRRSLLPRMTFFKRVFRKK